jgi:hypothetical protein
MKGAVVAVTAGALATGATVVNRQHHSASHAADRAPTGPRAGSSSDRGAGGIAAPTAVAAILQPAEGSSAVDRHTVARRPSAGGVTKIQIGHGGRRSSDGSGRGQQSSDGGEREAARHEGGHDGQASNGVSRDATSGSGGGEHGRSGGAGGGGGGGNASGDGAGHEGSGDGSGRSGSGMADAHLQGSAATAEQPVTTVEQTAPTQPLAGDGGSGSSGSDGAASGDGSSAKRSQNGG